MRETLTILKETPRNVDKFKQIYAEDRFRARVYAFENSPSISIASYNNVAPGVFQIFNYQKSFGVSKTLKLYASKKTIFKYIVNKTKFYRVQNNKLFPITIGNIEKEYLDIFIEHFSWIRFLVECDIRDITLNTIVRNKLYSRDKVLRHMYGCHAEPALIISKNVTYREWRWFKKSVTNVENLNRELFNDRNLFDDAVRLAYKMNETVNLSWSVRRLKEEHDKWSKEYTDLVFELNNRKLNIHPIYEALNVFLGGGLLTTSKELAIEGSAQKHCVASYSHNVDSGRTAIFKVHGYTAEVINKGDELKLSQFKGYRNAEAPGLIRRELEQKIKEFNKTKVADDFKIQTYNWTMNFEPAGDLDIPF